MRHGVGAALTGSVLTLAILMRSGYSSAVSAHVRYSEVWTVADQADQPSLQLTLAVAATRRRDL